MTRTHSPEETPERETELDILNHRPGTSPPPSFDAAEYEAQTAALDPDYADPWPTEAEIEMAERDAIARHSADPHGPAARADARRSIHYQRSTLDAMRNPFRPEAIEAEQAELLARFAVWDATPEALPAAVAAHDQASAACMVADQIAREYTAWLREQDRNGVDLQTAAEGRIWKARPELKALYQNARRTDAAPWPMLVGAILRALHTIPSRVLYQSYRGTAALNAAAVFVGVSGGGKSLLQTQLDNAIPFHHGAGFWDFPAYEVGSGEALAETYITDRDRTSGEMTWTNDEHAVSFGFDEVGRLTKVGARQGSTLFEYLKTAVTGGVLGRRLANGGGLELPKNSYRFTAIINAQPERAAPLISDDEIAGGLPGRLIWVSMKDPSVRTEHDDSPVQPWRVKGLAWQADRIQALPEMDAAHREQAFEIAEGTGDALTGHEVMARVKLAVGLMVLNERSYLTSEDWELAGMVMEHSRSTRDNVFAAVRHAQVRESDSMGRSMGRRQVIAVETAQEMTIERVCGLLAKYQAQGVPESEWRHKLRSTDREQYADARALLLGPAD